MNSTGCLSHYIFIWWCAQQNPEQSYVESVFVCERGREGGRNVTRSIVWWIYPIYFYRNHFRWQQRGLTLTDFASHVIVSIMVKPFVPNIQTETNRLNSNTVDYMSKIVYDSFDHFSLTRFIRNLLININIFIKVQIYK